MLRNVKNACLALLVAEHEGVMGGVACITGVQAGQQVTDCMQAWKRWQMLACRSAQKRCWHHHVFLHETAPQRDLPGQRWWRDAQGLVWGFTLCAPWWRLGSRERHSAAPL